MSGTLAALAANPWLAMGALLSGFLLLFAGVQIYARAFGARAESSRKLLHTGSGILTLTFPFVFRETWPVFVLTAASALLIGAVRFSPVLRARFGHVAHRVDRTTLGELYFPVAVALLFWLTRGGNPLLFVIPMLMLTFGDATSALVGRRYGLTPYEGASKSLEGSIAFFVASFLCVHIPLLLWSSTGRIESLLIAAILALLVMLLEGSAWRGLDNLFIPIGGFFLLRAYLPMDTVSLAARLLVAIALIALLVSARRRTTLEDDSLVAGAFLCYVAWALMGWPWLIGPLAIALGYRWLSPPTRDNSRRMHGIPAVLSVWAPAVAWISIANARSEPAMVIPYSVVFAAHLAMFGISRLASQFPDRPLGPLLLRAVITSWALVMVPCIGALGARRPVLWSGFASAGAIALGTLLFARTQRDIRATPQTPRRWLYQTGAAGVASALIWAAMILIAGAEDP